MTITRLKEKNQITLPKSIVERLHLKKNELFEVGIEKNYIILIPVEVRPKYTIKELEKVAMLVKQGKKKAKSVKSGSEFSGYLDNME